MRATGKRFSTGEPHPVWGQAVTAYIVANDPATGDDVVASVDRRLRGCLAKYKVPKAYHRVDRLP